MQFDLRRFIASGRAGWEQTFDCDLSGRDFAGARIDKPVTARFTAQAAGGRAFGRAAGGAFAHI